MAAIYTNINDTREASKEGQLAAKLIVKKLKQRGIVVTKADRMQDMREHWDYRMTWEFDFGDEIIVNPRFDVKGRKKRRGKHSPFEDKWTCLETHGTLKDDMGWAIAGLAELIGFRQVNDSFIFFRRKDLVKFMEKYVKFNEFVNNGDDAKYKVFKRGEYFYEKDIRMGIKPKKRQYDAFTWVETEKLLSELPYVTIK